MAKHAGSGRTVRISRLRLSAGQQMADHLRAIHNFHGPLCASGTVRVCDVALHHDHGDGGIAGSLQAVSVLLQACRVLNLGTPDREEWLVLKHDESDPCDNGCPPPVESPGEPTISFMVRADDSTDQKAVTTLLVLEDVLGRVVP